MYCRKKFQGEFSARKLSMKAIDWKTTLKGANPNHISKKQRPNCFFKHFWLHSRVFFLLIFKVPYFRVQGYYGLFRFIQLSYRFIFQSYSDVYVTAKLKSESNTARLRKQINFQDNILVCEPNALIE